MNNIAYKYNRFLIYIIAVAPFAAFFSVSILHLEFSLIMQFLSYIGVILLLVFGKESNPLKFPNYLIFYLLFTIFIFYSTFFILERDFKFKYLFTNSLIGAFNFMFIIENVPI